MEGLSYTRRFKKKQKKQKNFIPVGLKKQKTKKTSSTNAESLLRVADRICACVKENVFCTIKHALMNANTTR